MSAAGCAILLRVPFYILHETVHQFSLRDSEACIPRHPTAPTHTHITPLEMLHFAEINSPHRPSCKKEHA